MPDVDSDDLKIETTKQVFATAPSKRTAEKGIDAGVADGEEKITDIDCKGTTFCARYITTEILNNYNPNIHHRKSIRLKGYDYSKAGLYFITICVQDRKCLFGKIVGIENFQPKMVLNDAGKIADECWLEIPKHFPNVVLHEHIVMPNHVHGIVGVQNFQPLQIWQRNYYEHIIRNEQSYQKIADYIKNNPKDWKEDKFFKD